MSRKRVKVSDQVRCYNWRSFRALDVGARFRFASEVDMPFAGMKTGVCMKLSARKYAFVADQMVRKVGSVHVLTIPVEEDGTIKRVAQHTPYLGD